MKQITLRLSSAQLRQLHLLEEKLHIDRASVIRLAIARLAETEKVGTSMRRSQG
jgi:hypothetical protein